MALRKSPRGQALLIVSIVVGIYAVGIIVLDLAGIVDNIYWQVGLGVFLFVVSYLIIHRVFLSYVEKRLNPVFKTIQNVAMSQKKIRERIDSSDFSETLDREVKDWASNQTDEIRQLREMEKYRKDFLGNVSHELKTPIFNIQGYILTLLEGGIDDSKVNKLYLKRAEKSINRMISIVDDLVSISRLESGEFKLKLEEFNIVRLVEEIFEQHEMLAKQFKIKLDFDSSYKSPIKVKADRRRMTEVLNNLIVNSIKYGKANGKTKVGTTDIQQKWCYALTSPS
jgi:two-component system phosphate regulon sensor histidine kinase PhoR